MSAATPAPVLTPRQKRTREIEKHALPEHRAALLWFLAQCKSENQFCAFVVCQWDKTGPRSFDAVRRWVPSAFVLTAFHAVEAAKQPGAAQV